MDKTLSFYNQNASGFVQDTLNVEFAAFQEKFASLLPSGACILDFGCGSGRDTKYFLDKGFSESGVKRDI